MSVDAWIHEQIEAWAKKASKVELPTLSDFIDKCIARIVKAKWHICFRDCGMRHGDYGVSAKIGKQTIVIVDGLSYRELAESICERHNAVR